MMFIIDVFTGKNVSSFSAIPSEKEVLLPPNAVLFVAEVSSQDESSITVIHLVEKTGSFKW